MTIKTQPFGPNLNYTITGTNTSVPQAIAQPNANQGGMTGAVGNLTGYNNIRIYNPNAYVGYVAWSMGTATATAGDLKSAIIPATATITYDMGIPAKSVAVILGTASTGSIYISVGDGGA
jgi:hypothetical protein